VSPLFAIGLDVPTVGVALLAGLAAWILASLVERASERSQRGHAAALAALSLRLGGIAIVSWLLFQVPVALGLGDLRWGGVTGEDILRALVLLVAGGVVVRSLARHLGRRLETDGHRWRAVVVEKTISYGGAVVVLLLVADAVQFDLSALLATAGVVGVAVGFAAQTSLSNVIAGVFLLIDRPFSPGDVILVEGQLGTVDRISMMSTFVRTFDNLTVRWPNEVVLKATITNYSAQPARRVDLVLRLDHDTPVGAVRRALVEAVQACPLVLLEPATEIRLVDLADNGVTLSVRAWVRRTTFLDARDEIITAIKSTLRGMKVQPRVPAYEVHYEPEELHDDP